MPTTGLSVRVPASNTPLEHPGNGRGHGPQRDADIGMLAAAGLGQSGDKPLGERRLAAGGGVVYLEGGHTVGHEEPFPGGGVHVPRDRCTWGMGDLPWIIAGRIGPALVNVFST